MGNGKTVTVLRIRMPALAWHKKSGRWPELRIAAQLAGSRLGVRACVRARGALHVHVHVRHT